MFKNSFSIGYSLLGLRSINSTGRKNQAIERCPLSAAVKFRVPDKDIRSFLKDTGELEGARGRVRTFYSPASFP